jgi:hypothetical protein
MTPSTDEKLAAIRADFEKAEAEIATTLARDPRDFPSPAEHRKQFNQARSLKLSASQRMAVLKAQEGQDLSGFA